MGIPIWMRSKADRPMPSFCKERNQLYQSVMRSNKEYKWPNSNYNQKKVKFLDKKTWLIVLIVYKATSKQKK